MTEYQIQDRTPNGFSPANQQQVDRYLDTGSVNGAAKVVFVRTNPDHASYAESILAQRAGVEGALTLAVRLKPPRTIGDIESIARRETTDLERYKSEYNAGWKASGRGSDWPDGTSHSWDDGYLDRAAGRAKWHLTWCLDHDNCGEG